MVLERFEADGVAKRLAVCGRSDAQVLGPSCEEAVLFGARALQFLDAVESAVFFLGRALAD